MGRGGEEVHYTKHALDQMESRNIPYNWVEEVIAEPVLRQPDPTHAEIERFYGPVTELGGRYLRVAVNTAVTPWRIVTVFVDSSAGGRK